MLTDNQFLELRDLVWSYRIRLCEHWPTPAQADAMRFAFTEVAEALDAYLRSKPEYNRNNAKTLDVCDELADTAIMLITAAGIDWKPPKVGIANADIDHIAHLVASAYSAAFVDFDIVPQNFVALAIHAIAGYSGMGDLAQRVEGRLKRIEARVLPAASLNGTPLSPAVWRGAANG